MSHDNTYIISITFKLFYEIYVDCFRPEEFFKFVCIFFSLLLIINLI